MPRASLRVILCSVLAFALPACADAVGAASYATKVKFAKGRALNFPDFDLTHTGKRHVASPRFPRGFDYDDFTVSRGGVSKTVSWSAGTGLIDWVDFEFAGKNFALELRGSRKFGWLKENELVVTKQ
jgi:hypothetical protein